MHQFHPYCSPEFIERSKRTILIYGLVFDVDSRCLLSRLPALQLSYLNLHNASLPPCMHCHLICWPIVTINHLTQDMTT